MNMSTDPYKLLRAELVRAANSVAPADLRRRGWRAHPRLLAASATAMAAAAAVVVSLTGAPANHLPASHAPAGHPGFALTQAPTGKVTVSFVDQTGPSTAQIAAFNQALAAIGTRMGRPAETLVQTTTGLDVRCPDGQLIQTTSTNSSQGTEISWNCSPASPASQQPEQLSRVVDEASRSGCDGPGLGGLGGGVGRVGAPLL
jgi:hypothetical protein